MRQFGLNNELWEDDNNLMIILMMVVIMVITIMMTMFLKILISYIVDVNLNCLID